MYYITDKNELNTLRRIALGKTKIPDFGVGIYIQTADAARAECRWCRTRIRKGEDAVKVSFSDGRYINNYQVHLKAKECVIDPRITRKWADFGDDDE